MGYLAQLSPVGCTGSWQVQEGRNLEGASSQYLVAFPSPAPTKAIVGSVGIELWTKAAPECDAEPHWAYPPCIRTLPSTQTGLTGPSSGISCRVCSHCPLETPHSPPTVINSGQFCLPRLQGNSWKHGTHYWHLARMSLNTLHPEQPPPPWNHVAQRVT